jgi:hypothetical protein
MNRATSAKLSSVRVLCVQCLSVRRVSETMQGRGSSYPVSQSCLQPNQFGPSPIDPHAHITPSTYFAAR